MSRTTARRRALHVLALAATVLGSLTLSMAVGPSAAAQSTVSMSVERVGWWTSDDGATSPGPGGFQIAAGSTGDPVSVAALELDIDAGSVASATLTLTQDSSDFTDDTGIMVCATTSDWSDADGGPLEEAPAQDCAAGVELTLADGAWTGDIAPLLDSGTNSVIVLPDYQPPLTFGPGMQIAISATAIVGTGTPATTAPTTTAATTNPPTTRAPATTRPAVIIAPPTTRSVATTQPPVGDPAGSNLTASPPPVQVTLAPPVTSAPDDEEFFTLGPAQEFEGDATPWSRLLILVPASLALGFGSLKTRNFLAQRS